MLFADAFLARRLEAAEAAVARGCGGRGTPILETAGGCAVFLGPESPLTQVVGLGLNGAVSEAEFSSIEDFFRSRGARVKIELCPLADAGLLDIVSARGYQISEFSNVLARRLGGEDGWAAPRARGILPGEETLWARTVARGFFDEPELTDDEIEVGKAITGIPGVSCYFATEAGELAAGGAMAIHDRVAALFADSTVPSRRRLGLQRELIAARLAEARERGCDTAMASTLPGSPSQRNYERLGFEVVYTRLTLVS